MNTATIAAEIVKIDAATEAAMAAGDLDTAATLGVDRMDQMATLRRLVMDQMAVDWDGANKSYRTAMQMEQAVSGEQYRRIEALLAEARG